MEGTHLCVSSVGLVVINMCYIGHHMTEDHCFMMSKSLHRDEDMVLEYVRSRFHYYQPTLLKHLSKLDSLKSGQLPAATFMVGDYSLNLSSQLYHGIHAWAETILIHQLYH